MKKYFMPNSCFKFLQKKIKTKIFLNRYFKCNFVAVKYMDELKICKLNVFLYENHHPTIQIKIT